MFKILCFGGEKAPHSTAPKDAVNPSNFSTVKVPKSSGGSRTQKKWAKDLREHNALDEKITKKKGILSGLQKEHANLEKENVDLKKKSNVIGKQLEACDDSIEEYEKLIEQAQKMLKNDGNS